MFTFIKIITGFQYFFPFGTHVFSSNLIRKR